MFAVLKSETANERFVFITGITKFTQISLFSVLNNLSNVSFLPHFATLCGITEQEIHQNLYAAPFQSEGKPVVALAVELDDEGKGILGWSEVG